MTKKLFKNAKGFSTAQLIITLAVMATITSLAIIGISRARASIRLSGSARQFAAFVERARADAIRRHANSVVQTIDTNTYSVTMDFDNTGTVTTRNFNLQEGVVFTTGVKSITFDWRGRIPQEESFGFHNGSNSVSVGVTGSGDVTFDAQFFHDASLPPVTLNGQGGSVIPDPSPSPGGGGNPSPSPSPNATPDVNPSPTPTPTPTPTPGASPTPTPTPTPSPGASPTPTAGASPTPTPAPCTMSANPSSLSILGDGSASVSVNRNSASGSGTITAASNNTGQIQVSPSSQNVSGTGAASFTVTVKKTEGSVTFSSAGCSSITVPVTIR